MPSGRLLTDGTSIDSYLVLLEDKQRKTVKEATTGKVPNAGQALTWLHRSVRPELVQGKTRIPLGVYPWLYHL